VVGDLGQCGDRSVFGVDGGAVKEGVSVCCFVQSWMVVAAD